MLRLRQVVTVASELRPVETQLIEQLGLEVAYRDPGLRVFGLRHGLYPIGDRLLEVVSPREDGTTAGRYLDRRGGDGGYMIILQVDDLEPYRRRMGDLGIRLVYEPTGPGIEGLHLHPADVGGAILSIDVASPAESWGWAGPDWPYHSTGTVVTDIVATDIQATDPSAMAARWAALLGTSADEGNVVRLDDAELRFVEDRDGRGPGVAGFDVVATDRSRVGEELTIGGVYYRLV